jgi:hypothetical protein
MPVMPLRECVYSSYYQEDEALNFVNLSLRTIKYGLHGSCQMPSLLGKSKFTTWPPRVMLDGTVYDSGIFDSRGNMTHAAQEV